MSFPTTSNANLTGSNPTQVCPFMGSPNDRGVWYSYAHEWNYCHLAKPAGSVSLVHQNAYCLTKDYASCKVFADMHEGPLPSDISGLGRFKQSSSIAWRSWMIIGMTIIGIAFIALSVLLNNKTDSSSAFESTPAGYLEGTASPVPPATVTPTPLALQIPIGIAQITNSITPTSQPTASPTITETPTAILPTAGPAEGTPFGPNKEYIYYVLKEGESLANVAVLFGTNVEVIKATNIFIEGASVWPGTVLLIIPGRTDPTGLKRFKIIYLDVKSSVKALAETHNISEDELRRLNSLGSDDIIPAGRWIIVPYNP